MKKYYLFVYLLLLFYTSCQTLSKEQQEMLGFVGWQLEENLELSRRSCEDSFDKIKKFQYYASDTKDSNYVNQAIREAEIIKIKRAELIGLLDNIKKSLGNQIQKNDKQKKNEGDYSLYFLFSSIQKNSWKILEQDKLIQKIPQIKQKVDDLLQIYKKINLAKKWKIPMESPLKNPSNASFEDYHLQNVPPLVALNGITSIEILIFKQENKYLDLLFEELHTKIPQAYSIQIPKVHIKNSKETYKIGDTYQPLVYTYYVSNPKSKINWIKVNGQTLPKNADGTANFLIKPTKLGKQYMDIDITINYRGRDTTFTRKYWYEVVK